MSAWTCLPNELRFVDESDASAGEGGEGESTGGEGASDTGGVAGASGGGSPSGSGGSSGGAMQGGAAGGGMAGTLGGAGSAMGGQAGAGAGSSGSSGSGGAVPACASGTFLFCDDFEDGMANGWAGGKGVVWTVQTDVTYVYVGNVAVGSFSSSLAAGTGILADQTIQGRVNVRGGAGAGIIARGASGYAVGVDPTEGDLTLFEAGNPVSGGVGTCGPVASSLATATWYWLRLRISGPTNSVRLVTSISMDGSTFVPAHDCTDSSGVSSGGLAGVWIRATGTEAAFDDFTTTTP